MRVLRLAPFRSDGPNVGDDGRLTPFQAELWEILMRKAVKARDDAPIEPWPGTGGAYIVEGRVVTAKEGERASDAGATRTAMSHFAECSRFSKKPPIDPPNRGHRICTS
jgi:hypothetical protein